MVCLRGESLITLRDQMKLFNAIAAAVIGSSFVAATSANAETVSDRKQGAAGFLAQMLCSQRVNDWPLAYAHQKRDIYRQAYPKNYPYLSDPQVMKVASILSMSMNNSCSAFNTNSSDFKRGMQMSERL